MDEGQRQWTFLTNHGHVLVCIAADADVRVRDIAEQVGITQRAAQNILNDLLAAGYVDKERVGRRNRYTISPRHRLRHPLEEHVAVRDFLSVIVSR